MLHIIRSLETIATALAYSSEKDDILLVESAVYASISQHALIEVLRAHRGVVYALQADLEARGLSELLDNEVTQVNFTGFVELTISNETSMTW